MLGTFIVRSGVLTSVHAFAVDPKRGLFLLILLSVLTVGALLVWALRAPKVAEGARFAPFSREGFLVANNLILMALLSIVFVGTLYPLALEGWNGRQISVGPPYFNATTVPLVLLLGVLMGIGPFLAWKRGGARNLSGKLVWPMVGAAVLPGLAIVIFGLSGVLAALGLAVAGWLAVASLMLLFRRGLSFMQVGTAVAHLGVALVMVGATASGAFQREALVSIRVGDSFSFSGFDVTLKDVRPAVGPNWTALEATLEVARDGTTVTTLKPQARTYTSPPMETTEAGITGWRGGDLYAVLGKPDGMGRWQIHMWVKPLVHLLWAGAILMSLGSALALGGARRLRSLGVRRPAAGPDPLPQPAE
jgi:cytochrome c-type biogenesis protein CcmF